MRGRDAGGAGPREDDGRTAFPDGRPLGEQPRWRRDFPIDVPRDNLVARRDFVKFLVVTSGAFAAGQATVWVESRLRVRADATLSKKRIATAADVACRGVVRFGYPGDDDPCLLMRLDSGELVAYSQLCTHLSCAVEPRLDEGKLRCPCHNGWFDAGTGRPVSGPPRRPLPQIRLQLDRGVIYAIGIERRT